MAMALKAGARFKSAVCDTQVMVIKSPPGEHELRCGGADMLGGSGSGIPAGSPHLGVLPGGGIATAPAGAALDPAQAGETLIGKRYVNADESLELLCTKGGKGSLSLGGTPLEIKQAKQLPSSD